MTEKEKRNLLRPIRREGVERGDMDDLLLRGAEDARMGQRRADEKKRPESDLVRSAVLGLAIGDAMGVPVEFQSREALQENPVADYRGFGSHPVPEGTWSDDTSMTLATLDSLCDGVNEDDLMRRFCKWKNENAYTATGEVFDMGITTHDALVRFENGMSPLECGSRGEQDNGNGALMRILPAALYCKYQMAGKPLCEQMEVIHRISALTHAHPRSEMGCGIYAIILMHLADAPVLEEIFPALCEARDYYQAQPAFQKELSHYARLFEPGFAALPANAIRTSGYVVSTLEAAIWCLLNTSSYAECILKAVNLGYDTDTVAAVAGGLAGCLYGEEGIPGSWVRGLRKKEDLFELCKKFETNCMPIM